MDYSRRYCLITPCRDEEAFAHLTIDSVARQSVLPALWVIVDDGSRDGTPGILEAYAKRYPWIHLVRRPDRGDRALGGGVIEAFYAGYTTLCPNDFEYICKLDLDLELPPRYFEHLMLRMEANPRIGTCSGKAYFPTPRASVGPHHFPLSDPGRYVSEKVSDDHSLGMAKFYRRTCFQEIGGFVRQLMWDGIDSHRCRQLGWIAVSWDAPELRFVHLRPMGTSHKNWWVGRVRHGVGQYFMGTGPLWMLAAALYRMSRPPLLIGGCAMLWGYFRSMLRQEPRFGDEHFRNFLRRYQWDCLLKGRARAMRETDARQAPIWSQRLSFVRPTASQPGSAPQGS